MRYARALLAHLDDLQPAISHHDDTQGKIRNSKHEIRNKYE